MFSFVGEGEEGDVVAFGWDIDKIGPGSTPEPRYQMRPPW